MRLKALKPRLYNSMFHTHTVSGIVICVALYIIFYAGAFALFRHELYTWENHQARNIENRYVTSDKILEKVAAHYEDFEIDGQTTIVFNRKDQPYIQFYGDLHPEDGEHRRVRALINPITWEVFDNENPKTTVAETLYHLHYFDQIPQFGIWLSGFVSLFFLFAIITGVLIHWKNLVRKFYAFSPKAKWKVFWTDAHTTLSLIGLPFQVVYAVTGCLFGLLTLLLAPSVILMFNGSTDPVYENIAPARVIKFDEEAPMATMVDMEKLRTNLQQRYPEHHVDRMITYNYGKSDGVVEFLVDDGRGIVNDGVFVYNLVTGQEIASVVPNDKSYSQTIYNLMTKLHFGSYGGMLLRVVYFILAMITCFSFVSGILIWKTARQNKKYTAKQQKFHHQVTKVFLAICLGLFPATALLFVANKAIPFSVADRAFYENAVFFGGWALLICLGLFWNNLRQLNRRYLFIGAIFSLAIPVLNGLVTGDWFFHSLAISSYTVASVDIFWLLTGVSALLIVHFTKKAANQG